MTDRIFVFGSNEAGIHGAGAAKFAHEQKGAKWGVGVGLKGQSYAIPTKSEKIETLPLGDIEGYVNAFILHAACNPLREYEVTAIGCGLAGYTREEIAPLFKYALILSNVLLPSSFLKILGREDLIPSRVSFDD